MYYSAVLKTFGINFYRNFCKRKGVRRKSSHFTNSGKCRFCHSRTFATPIGYSRNQENQIKFNYLNPKS